MLPLNLAILKYFTSVERACAEDVIDALKADYGRMRGLRKKAVIDALMTAEKNGLLVEDEVTLDDKGELVMYYRTTEESCAMIRRYLR